MAAVLRRISKPHVVDISVTCVPAERTTRNGCMIYRCRPFIMYLSSPVRTTTYDGKEDTRRKSFGNAAEEVPSPPRHIPPSPSDAQQRYDDLRGERLPALGLMTRSRAYHRQRYSIPDFDRHQARQLLELSKSSTQRRRRPAPQPPAAIRSTYTSTGTRPYRPPDNHRTVHE